MLDIKNVSRSFGALQALSNVSLAVGAGEIIGLIGPNGSGKSTLLNLITGIYPVESGSIRFGDKEIGNERPNVISAMGIARTFQTPRLYHRMTVRENLHAASHTSAAGSSAATNSVLSAIDNLLELADLVDRANDLATNLSLPEQRRLELVRTQVANPKLVLLDEPAGGMTPAETADMAVLIRTVLQAGQSCIVIEHKMEMISALCNRVVVLNFGKIISDGEKSEVFTDPDVIAAYLGPEQVV